MMHLFSLFSRFFISTALLLGSLFMLSACDKSPNSQQNILTYAQSAQPKEPELAEIYQRSCKICHANISTQAPLTGDVEAWQKRKAKGMQELVDNVINGYGGMPPLGLCMDCSENEFIALIEFMALPPSQ